MQISSILKRPRILHESWRNLSHKLARLSDTVLVQTGITAEELEVLQAEPDETYIEPQAIDPEVYLHGMSLFAILYSMAGLQRCFKPPKADCYVVYYLS